MGFLYNGSPGRSVGSVGISVRPGGGRGEGVENVGISRKLGFSLANFELGLLRDQTELGVEI